MNNRQARKTGRTIMVCGFIMVVLNQLWIGLAMVAVGILFSAFLGRCPHCGRFLLGVPTNAPACPKCHGPL